VTVVAGYTDGKTWSIGGDSGAFEDNLYQLTGEPKVWKSGDALLGASGSFRVMEIARKSGLSDPYSLRNHLLEANPGGEWAVMVVTRKAIYEIADDFSVLPIKENYCSIGAGNAIALGVLSVLAEEKRESAAAVKTALRVAGRHSQFAVPPYTVLTL
jgi:hypothetical protein